MDSLNVQDIRSVCVFNISPSANEKTVTDFFFPFVAELRNSC